MKSDALAFIALLVVCGLCPVVTARKPKITPEKEEIIIQEGDELRLECRGEGELRFSKQETMANGSEFNTFKNKSSNVYTFISSKTVRADTGWYACAKKGISIRNDEKNIDHESKDIAWIYVYVNSSEPFAIDASFDLVTTVAGSSLVVPCRPTSPNVTVGLTIDWGATNLPENTTYDPKIGFIVPEIATEQSGQNFECSVDGPEVKTASFTLHVAAPAILEDPKINLDRIRHVVWGKDMTVDCNITAPHNTLFTMSWKVPKSVPKERWSFSPQPESVSSESSGMTWKSELTVRDVKPSDGGEYACVVDHLENELETRELVRIWDPDNTYINATVEGNYSITPSLGEDHAQWKIEIDAYPENFTWKWLKPDGQEITREDLIHKSKYSHSIENLWHFFHVFKLNVEDNGKYTLELSNSARQITIALQLTVLAKPSVLLDEVQPFYSLGKLATFSCQTTGQPSPNITWIIKEYPDVSSKENFELKYPSNVTTKQGPKGPYQSVSTLDVIINQTGEVTCRSCNEINCDNKTRFIFVSDVDGRFGIIDPGVVTEGDDINVTCGASVYNFTDTITWIPEDSEKQEFNTSRIYPIKQKSNFTSQSILRIRNVQRSDTGKFICQAVTNDEHGSTETEEYQLVVNYAFPPKFTNNSMEDDELIINLHDENYKRNTVTILQCFVEGRPKPELIWYQDEEPIAESPQFTLLDNNSTLRIEYFLDGDSGRYMCEARNRIGTAARYMDVKVSGKSQSVIVWISLICVLIAIIIIVITYMGIRVQRERKLRMELNEAGLTHFEDGALECLNPDLTVDDQAELLPYDKKWEFPRENLKLGKQLGSGAFGVVMKAEARGICVEGEVTTVAVKMVRRTAEPSYMKALSSELKIMIHLGRHLNVVNLLGACTKTVLTKRELYVIVEYCRFGNLHNYLQRHRSSFIDQIDPVTQKIDSNIGIELLVRSESNAGQKSMSIRSSESNSGSEQVDYRQGADFVDINMSPDGGVLSNNSVQPGWRSNYRGDYKDQNLKPICTQDLLCWAWQVSRGMEYLSSRNVLHGDLAARNILLADDNIVKICDFGLAKNMYKDNNYKKKGDSPLPIKWMAIESIRDRMFSTHSDVWSFGIVLWEFFTLARTPYPGMEAEKQYERLIEGYRMEKPEYATDEIYEMMTHCWKAKPSLRPSFPELAEKIGTLLNDSIVMHFMDLNTPYMEMNTVAMQNGQSDYLAMMSSPNHDYDNAPEPMSPGRPDSTYLPMSPMAKACDSGIFSPRSQLEESHFKFPSPAKITPINSDSEDCIDADPGSMSEDSYLKPIDVKQRRANFAKLSEEHTTIKEDPGYCNITIKPDLHYPSLNNQPSENIKDLDHPRSTEKFQKIVNNDLSPVITTEQKNYCNIPKPKPDILTNTTDSFSNPSYVMMSK